MKDELTPKEQHRAELLRCEIIKKVEAYLILRDNADTRKYSRYMDVVDKMLITGNYDPKDIATSVANEALFLERFGSITRAYNEVNALTKAYKNVFEEDPLPEELKDALQEMKSSHQIGLETILRILEDRTEQLLKEILK